MSKKDTDSTFPEPADQRTARNTLPNKHGHGTL